jgi:hypothetical protein
MKAPLIALFSGLSLLAAQAMADDKQVYGLHEKALLPELGLELPAKLDTGAVTASLSARNIETFKRDGERWVRFQLAVDDQDEPHTPLRPPVRTRPITRRAGDMVPGDTETYTARPVIEMPVCMGDSLQRIEVNLTDRSAFDFPLLIGSTALAEFDAVVDPSLTFSTGRPGCA